MITLGINLTILKIGTIEQVRPLVLIHLAKMGPLNYDSGVRGKEREGILSFGEPFGFFAKNSGRTRQWGGSAGLRPVAEEGGISSSVGVSLSKGFEGFQVVLDNSESCRVPYIPIQELPSGRDEKRFAAALMRIFVRSAGRVFRIFFLRVYAGPRCGLAGCDGDIPFTIFNRVNALGSNRGYAPEEEGRKSFPSEL